MVKKEFSLQNFIELEEKGEVKDLTVSENLDKLLKEDIKYLDENILGLPEFKDQIRRAIERAATIAREGYVPIIAIYGPTGSGKTLSAFTLANYYLQAIKEGKIQAYSFLINGERAKYSERPANLLSSPIDLDGIKTKIDVRTQVSRDTIKKLTKLSENKHNLENEITIVSIFPNVSYENINALDKQMYSIIEAANRGFLIIDADVVNWKELPKEIFYALTNLYDNNIFLPEDGTKVPLDMLILITTNEKFERIDNPPLFDRMIWISSRRNLSWELEKEMIKKHFPKMPSSPTFEEYIDIISKLAILSRIDFSKSFKGVPKSYKSVPFLTYQLQEILRNNSSYAYFGTIHNILKMLNTYEKGESPVITRFALDEILEGEQTVNGFITSNLYVDKPNGTREYLLGLGGWSIREVFASINPNQDVTYIDILKFLESYAEPQSNSQKEGKYKINYHLLWIWSQVRTDIEKSWIYLKAKEYVNTDKFKQDMEEYINRGGELNKNYETFLDKDLIVAGAQAWWSIDKPITSIKYIKLEEALRGHFITYPEKPVIKGEITEDDFRKIYKMIREEKGGWQSYAEIKLYREFVNGIHGLINFAWPTLLASEYESLEKGI